MITRTIATIEGEPILLHDDGSITFTAKAAIDVDGIGSHHGDPCAQSDTSLHTQGHALNADEDRYVVAPPAIIGGVAPVVKGCRASVFNRRNQRRSEAVVGDIGPHHKLGEISRALAIVLGIDPSPTSGGEEAHVIEYTLWPGVPAVVEGKTYQLQPA